MGIIAGESCGVGGCTNIDAVERGESTIIEAVADSLIGSKNGMLGNNSTRDGNETEEVTGGLATDLDLPDSEGSAINRVWDEPEGDFSVSATGGAARDISADDCAW